MCQSKFDFKSPSATIDNRICLCWPHSLLFHWHSSKEYILLLIVWIEVLSVPFVVWILWHLIENEVCPTSQTKYQAKEKNHPLCQRLNLNCWMFNYKEFVLPSKVFFWFINRRPSKSRKLIWKKLRRMFLTLRRSRRNQQARDNIFYNWEFMYCFTFLHFCGTNFQYALVSISAAILSCLKSYHQAHPFTQLHLLPLTCF